MVQLDYILFEKSFFCHFFNLSFMFKKKIQTRLQKFLSRNFHLGKQKKVQTEFKSSFYLAFLPFFVSINSFYYILCWVKRFCVVFFLLWTTRNNIQIIQKVCNYAYKKIYSTIIFVKKSFIFAQN